ncbi:phosphoglycolate phosphatase [Halocatena halophila]|uniref:phosphoglycolate phosphatase n=1 Tax=Halocatena halophila TaxID=2814576 RepID=UPI002ED53319
MQALAVDIDGTLTRPDGSIDPRVFDPLRAWDGPVIIATGKSIPFPIGLCDFIGIPTRVIAENGGAIYTADDDELTIVGDRANAQRVIEAYRAAGYETGWGGADLVNRWRETEYAVAIDQPLEPLRALAHEAGLRVFDTGYAYHVTDPSIDKGAGLCELCDRLSIDPASVVAIGDSENDVAMFEVAGEAIAVANADERAAAVADRQTSNGYASGVLEALESVVDR